jgi:hypothetical protein
MTENGKHQSLPLFGINYVFKKSLVYLPRLSENYLDIKTLFITAIKQVIVVVNHRNFSILIERAKCH